MDSTEIAIRYGVPTPEICKKLNWQKETLFVWVGLSDYANGIEVSTFFIAKRIPDYFEHKKDDLYVSKKNQILIFENTPNIRCLDRLSVWFPAPQMHEIAEFLPNYLDIPNSKYLLDLDSLCWYKDGHFEFKIDIQKGNFAQAYAEIYLKLQEQGLLKPQNNG